MRTLLARALLIALAGMAVPASHAADEDVQPLRWHVTIVPAQAKPGDEVEVVFTADIAPGWILYSSDFKVELGPLPAKFTFDANPALELAGPIQALKAHRKKDRTLGGEYSYFEAHAEFRQKARLVSPAKSVSGLINGQTCFEKSGLCELFREKFSADL
ncbi:MAG: protein-disulfide reductase DsbD domain-containing protein [Gammaproteobacteria bacterium]